MVGGEFCRIKDVIGSTVRVSRGCADTIPKSHSAGTPVWFFQDDIGTDRYEYIQGDVIGVKVLMKTATRMMGVVESPPNRLPMYGRFARPYAPGQVFVGSQPFYMPSLLNPTTDVLDLTWAHRDRVAQGDQMIGHEVSSIGPEAGTTYNVEVRRADDDTLVRIETGIVGAAYIYTLDMATDDFALTPGVYLEVPAYLTLASVRDSYTSFEKYRMDFIVNASAGGWGIGWGLSWGG